MQAVTIKTLAATLNLSTATVSKALNDNYDISKETKRRVRQLAKELNYVPDVYASSLRSRKSRTIAVVIPEVADSFFAEAINGIEAVSGEQGYHVLIYLTHEDFERDKSILNEFKNGRVDGVLISITAATKSYDHIETLVSNDIPVVFFDRVCEEMDTAKIITNDYESGYLATRHLVEKGCRNIRLLSVSESLSISNRRKEGFLRALQDHALPSDERNVIPCLQYPEGNNRLVKELLSGQDPPDGIIATVEKLTISVYLACYELGIRIPADMKVISFSNLPSAAFLDPPLTTITQPAYAMGEKAASILFRGLNKKKFDYKRQNVVIPSVLNIRQSTAG